MTASIKTILKPSKYRAVDTSGNNNHGQIYSGRALEFDGVSDYLKGPTTSELPCLSIEKNFTTACWVKVDTMADRGIWGMSLSGGSDRTGLVIGADGEIAFTDWNGSTYNHVSGGTEGEKIIESNTWYRVVCTMTPSRTKKLYINGILQTGTSPAYGSALGPISTLLHIGKTGHTHTNHISAKISDFQVWDATWTQSDVTFDYLNPESLALNNGGTSLTESNLKLWYPMQDGHRGQQSYIMDGANTGLGDELIVNGDYSDTTSTNSSASALAGWTNSGITHDENNNVSISNGQATLISDGSDVRIQQTILTVGVTYKYSIDIISASSGAIKLQTSASFDTGGISTAGTHTGYFTADDTVFRIRRSGACNITFDNVSIKPVNDKHHATTEFLGDDLFDAGVGDYSDSTGGWTAEANNTVDNNDSALRITFVDDDDGARLDLNDAEDLTTDLTVGRTYRLSFEYKINQVTGSNVILQINTGTGSFVSSTALIDTSFSGTPVTKDFVATHATGAEIKFNNMDSGDILHLKNFTLKEVGVASGWTDADQQLDIAQTALQSYNQLAWWKENSTATETDASTEYITIVDGNSSTYTAESVSFWFITNNSEEQVLLSGLMNITSYGSIVIGGENDAGKISCAHTVGATNKCETDTTWHDGEWHHCTVIKLASDASPWFDIYVDGEKQPVTVGSGAHRTSDKTLVGARHSSGYFHKLDGCITEISAWNVVLTAAQVEELYNDGKALNALEHSSYTSSAGNLEGYWRNNGLAAWTNLKDPGTNDGTVSAGLTETLLLPAGVDASRDTQGYLMNRQKNTNSLNLPYSSVADGYVDLLEETTRAAGSAFSITLWVKPSHVDDNRFIGSGTDYIRFKNSTQIRISANGSVFNIALSSGTWNVNEWIHMGIVRDTSNDVTMYVDGESQNTVAVAQPFDYRYIGAFDASDTFDGAVDDVCIYNDELSAAEVKRNYNAGKRSHR